jgi:hypothetical protein
MNAINTYINAVNAHITQRIAISKAQAEFVTAYNEMTREGQSEARNAIARIIEARTGVKAIELEKGANKGLLGFTAKQAGGTDQSEAARAMLNYYLPKRIVEKSPTTRVRKSVDPVALLLKKFASMTAAQKRAFLKAVA